jgi:hypothetical protein
MLDGFGAGLHSLVAQAGQNRSVPFTGQDRVQNG